MHNIRAATCKATLFYAKLLQVMSCLKSCLFKSALHCILAQAGYHVRNLPLYFAVFFFVL